MFRWLRNLLKTLFLNSIWNDHDFYTLTLYHCTFVAFFLNFRKCTWSSFGFELNLKFFFIEKAVKNNAMRKNRKLWARTSRVYANHGFHGMISSAPCKNPDILPLSEDEICIYSSSLVNCRICRIGDGEKHVSAYTNEEKEKKSLSIFRSFLPVNRN